MGSFKSLYILTLLSTFFHVMMQYQAPSNLGILGHAYNLSTQEAEAVKSRVSVHLGLHIKILSQKQNKAPEQNHKASSDMNLLIS